MSGYGHPIHKFITKRKPRVSTIIWMPKVVTHAPARQRSGDRYEIFAQQAITIEPKTNITVEVGLGVRMTSGMCLVSLRQKLKQLRLSLQDGTVLEDAEDIIITIQNNSDSPVTINEKDSICYVNYYDA